MLSSVETLGTSMCPTFRPGDKAIVSWTEKQEQLKLEIGDIGVIRRNGETSLTFHRVIAKINNQYVFKGDRNRQIDNPNCEIVGIVIGIERSGKKHLWHEKGQRFKKIIAELSSSSKLELGKSKPLKRCWRALLIFVIYLVTLFDHLYWKRVFHDSLSN